MNGGFSRCDTHQGSDLFSTTLRRSLGDGASSLELAGAVVKVVGMDFEEPLPQCQLGFRLLSAVSNGEEGSGQQKRQTGETAHLGYTFFQEVVVIET